MPGLFEKFQMHMTAAAFAEAGEAETAREFLQTRKRPSKRKRLQVRQQADRPRPEMRASSPEE